MSNGKYRDFVMGVEVVFGEHDIGAGATTRFSDVEVGHVSMGSQDNIAGAIYDDVIGIGLHIVKQLRNGFISPCGRSGLLGTNRSK